MDLSYYQNFIAIVDAGTFSAAAEKLLIAQPTLSNQVKTLEFHYGTQLLDRGSRRLKPTPAGEVLYEHAKRICYTQEALEKELENMAPVQRVLRLGMTHASMDRYIERLLFLFHKEHPNVQFELSLHTSGQNAKLLSEGELDVGFIRVSENIHHSLNYLSTVEETLIVYYSPRNSWLHSSGDSIDISALKGIPLSMTIGLREKLIHLCEQSGFSPYCLCASATRDQALAWAKNDLAVTVLFCKSADIPQEGNLLHCKIKSLGFPVTALRSFVTSKDRAPSGTAKMFLEFVREYNENLR